MTYRDDNEDHDGGDDDDDDDDYFSQHSARGSDCLDAPSPTDTACSSVAQTFGTRPCSLKNRSLTRDIIQKTTFFRFSIKNETHRL